MKYTEEENMKMKINKDLRIMQDMLKNSNISVTGFKKAKRRYRLRQKQFLHRQW